MIEGKSAYGNIFASVLLGIYKKSHQNLGLPSPRHPIKKAEGGDGRLPHRPRSWQRDNNLVAAAAVAGEHVHTGVRHHRRGLGRRLEAGPSRPLAQAARVSCSTCST